MFPPVEQKILQSNPEFAKLYRVITTAILNPDGSTKDDDEAKDRAVVQKSLDKHRQKAAKHYLLERAIATATPPEPKPSSSSTASTRLSRASERLQQKQSQSSAEATPEALLELILILPSFLDTVDTLPHDSIALLLSGPPLSDFEALLPDLADLISSNLHASALGLARLAHPATNPSYLHRYVASLPKDFVNLNAGLAAAEETLKAARIRTITSLTNLLQLFSECLTCLVRTLEAKHGVIARSLELRASDISLDAQRAEKQAEQTMLKLRKEVYTAESISALQHYVTHLKDANTRVAEKVRDLQVDLEAYDDEDSLDEMDESLEEEGGGLSEVEHGGDYQDEGQHVEDTERDMDRLRLS
ncbi:hypothetical protein TRIATDRAFT_138671 [Trichoderma atroviride IMI 206040]|uniref:Uncharacterized protein n=1 Tax=Hypocrea atroviridis (strain ATCC 20476 / IMI 206040) TaxID=452589 RepID=G9NX58_HYPAI|nr:uncharacterized protein TRIATDRAFT_138671 [Trichoderma atroviride IMI 206040]EHK45491.1 hypothetical protein TRIATDRAFT_138671 [Trichoderma atroviride IMI 206040]